jgi:hypothetical protein
LPAKLVHSTYGPLLSLKAMYRPLLKSIGTGLPPDFVVDATPPVSMCTCRCGFELVPTFPEFPRN